MSNYSIGLSGLDAAQRALDVIGNNIANAATEGYHRQRVNLSPAFSTQEGDVLFGGGVNIKSVTRMIDDLLEKEILRRRRERRHDEVQIQCVVDQEQLLAMQRAVEEITVDADIESYIVDIVAKTRDDPKVSVGSSPRGSLALLKLTRARAAQDGRDYVLPDDVKAFASAALTHRLILEPDLWMRKHAAEDVIDDILQRAPVPINKGGNRS